MPLPSRTRSLRQPGYAHRELIEDIDQKGNGAKYGVERTISAAQRPETQEYGTSVSDVLNLSDGPPSSVVKAEPVDERVSRQHRRGRLALQDGTEIPSQQQDLRLDDRQVSAKAERSAGTTASPGAECNALSGGLPLLSQLSRSSSLRQPGIPLKRSEMAKRLHSRNASNVESSATGGTRQILPRSSSKQEPGVIPADAQLLPRPPHASSNSKSFASHQRSQSSGIVIGTRLGEAFPNGSDRIAAITRPQFSMYQQQFSPRKPRIHNTLAPVRAFSSNGSTDVDSVRALQDELLQLQLILLSSNKTLRAWIEDAEGKLNRQDEILFRETSNVGVIEQDQQNRINGAVLQEWLGIKKGKKSFERIGCLAHCIQTLSDLMRPTEKLSQVIGLFEEWYEITITIRSERSGENQIQEPHFAQSLGQGWARTVEALGHSFELCLRTLQELGAGDGITGLGTILDTHTRLTKNILEELHAMEAIHSLVLDQEDDWIRHYASDIVGNRAKSKLFPHNSKHPVTWDQVL